MYNGLTVKTAVAVDPDPDTRVYSLLVVEH